MKLTRTLAAASLLSAFPAFVLAGEVGVGLPAPELKVAKWIKGGPTELGKGRLHVIEMFATW